MEKLIENAKILIVDDSPQIVDILAQSLNKFNCRIALNGQNALKIAGSDFQPDLILLDINLPDMSGFDIIKKLKKDEKTKDVPVIFLTGYNNVENQVKCFELGGVDYISKPISIPVLLARVQNHLELYMAKEKLKMQNKELKLMGELREEIERIVQHDMKSPLTAVTGFSRMLIDWGDLNDKNLKMAKRIWEAGERLITMINNSLDLYKLETGNFDKKFKKINIIPLITSIMEELKTLNKAQNITYSITFNGHHPYETDSLFILGDENLFFTLFSNLLKNAVEASPQNEQIEITLSESEVIEISIHNKGAVPDEIKDRFFEKHVTRGKLGGSGFGTYSAKLITLNLNGQIEMQTSEEEGTLIRLRFLKTKNPN